MPGTARSRGRLGTTIRAPPLMHRRVDDARRCQTMPHRAWWRQAVKRVDRQAGLVRRARQSAVSLGPVAALGFDHLFGFFDETERPLVLRTARVFHGVVEKLEECSGRVGVALAVVGRDTYERL